LPLMGSMAAAKEWARKYQHFYPNNELFPSLIGEQDTQAEVVVNAKLEVYSRMLDAKVRKERR